MKASILESIRNRPRFKLTTPMTRDAYEKRLRSFLQSHKRLFTTRISKDDTVIGVKTSKDYFWKPYLSLRSETEDNRTVVRGIIGPSSSVWTFFMFLYFGIGMCWMTFFSLWIVTIQIKNDSYPWAGPVSHLCLLLLFLTWLASYTGKRLASKEIKILREFAEDSMTKIDYDGF